MSGYFVYACVDARALFCKSLKGNSVFTLSFKNTQVIDSKKKNRNRQDFFVCLFSQEMLGVL